MTTPALVLTLEQGMIEGLKLLEQKDKMKINLLPTTQVTAYVATDGSLWLNGDECLDKNRQLKDQKLLQHIDNLCEGARMDRADTGAILEYILLYSDEIKSILEK